MLEPEEVDEGYFTPVASTTLANIFKSDSGSSESVNPSLKYKPPQPKKTEPSPKPEDPNASHIVFSCSTYAYEWLQGSHKFKGKVGFAIMRMSNSGICKIILYSPDKSTLSCTTMTPELQVTLKGTMITLYDDQKKYWGLCLSDNIIDNVKEILQKENVIIKHYESPLESNTIPVKSDIEIIHTDNTEMKTDNTNITEEKFSALKNDKATILSRIANVGHAILPSTLASPTKKSNFIDKNASMEVFGSTDRLSVLSDESQTSGAKVTNDATGQIAIQTTGNNCESKSDTVTNNIKIDTQPPSLPIDNSQGYNPTNGNVAQMSKLIPLITNPDCGISASEIGVLVNKLTHLQGLVKAIEIFETFEKANNQICSCKDKDAKTSNLVLNPKNSEEDQRKNLHQINTLEQLIREKDGTIQCLQSELNIERMNKSDLQKEVENSKKRLEDLITKDELSGDVIPKSEADLIIANTVKKLMNATFRTLASNFENDSSYSGSIVKSILATVIKKQTVESLSVLLPSCNASNASSESTD